LDRRSHPRTILYWLGEQGVSPLPGRSSVYRALVRHRLIIPAKRKRRREDYRRWERSRAMELWQMDIVGRFHLKGGTELKSLTGVDDHSRFCVSARLMVRATARPVCQALRLAMATHGVPRQILTDNGRVFTARFSTGPGPVLFDRICVDNGVRHILTAPYSPTTTDKVERFHRTLRKEFFTPNDYLFETLEEAQRALDEWIVTYNTKRPHQSIGDQPPVRRFMLRATPSSRSWRPRRRRSTRSTLPPASPAGSAQTAASTSRASATRPGGGWRESRRGLHQGRARRDLPQRGGGRHPCPPPPAGQGAEDRQRAATAQRAEANERDERRPRRRHIRLGELRRLELPGRQPLQRPLCPSRHRQPQRPDLLRGSGVEEPPDPPRPLEGVRRLLDPERSAAQQGEPGRGLEVSGRYRSQSVRRVPELDTLTATK